MKDLFETLGAIVRPEQTEENLWKQQYETLLKEYSRVRKELDEWEVGGILWTWTDVECYASDEMDGLHLTEQQCKDILHEVIKYHDANTGITWNDFRIGIETYLQKNQ